MYAEDITSFPLMVFPHFPGGKVSVQESRTFAQGPMAQPRF